MSFNCNALADRALAPLHHLWIITHVPGNELKANAGFPQQLILHVRAKIVHLTFKFSVHMPQAAWHSVASLFIMALLIPHERHQKISLFMIMVCLFYDFMFWNLAKDELVRNSMDRHRLKLRILQIITLGRSTLRFRVYMNTSFHYLYRSEHIKTWYCLVTNNGLDFVSKRSQFHFSSERKLNTNNLKYRKTCL
jgi:hypothetical protein